MLVQHEDDNGENEEGDVRLRLRNGRGSAFGALLAAWLITYRYTSRKHHHQ